MKKIFWAGAALTSALTLASFGASAQSGAAPEDLAVENCWIRLLPQSLPAGGYFKIRNRSDHIATLIGLHTDAYGMSMLHQTQDVGGMSKMVMSHNIPVPAHGELVFAPGGYHAMLEKPAHKIEVGQKVDMAFEFADKTTVTTTCEVRPANAR